MKEEVGITTVARWMAEKLPRDMKAYMVYRDKLYQLKRIVSYNGSFCPVFCTLMYAALSEWSPRNVVYTLDSPVFLTLGKNLAGVSVSKIVGSMRPAGLGCWAMKDEKVRGVALDEQYALQRVAGTKGIDVVLPFCG